MTIEQKAKAYDEAKARISKAFNSNRCTIGFMNEIFPELKESEDERISKEIIYFLSRNTFQFGEEIDKYKSWVAWLEKQCLDKEHPDTCFIRPDIIFPELKESEDERIRNKIIDLVNARAESHDVEPMVAWLEKQGEQQSVDKVEPKFKVGDWVIVHNKDAYQVIGVNTYDYRLQHYLGGEMDYPFKYESDLKPWTIQDAKDGALLSDGTTIFIFKDLLSDGSVMSYCDYDTDSGESDVFCPLSVNLICSKITLATKEQRDLLFQKMHEAGYEWDAEKKELKEIINEKQIKKNLQDNSFRRMFEQKSAWSEDDKKMFVNIKACLRNANKDYSREID